MKLEHELINAACLVDAALSLLSRDWFSVDEYRAAIEYLRRTSTASAEDQSEPLFAAIIDHWQRLADEGAP